MPTVSVIVTTYNRKEYLTETIQSILNQTYQDYELIIVDNFSNYNFFEFIHSFQNEKIVPFQNHNNGIIAINRNFGIRQAKGEYLAFCDDDDIWFPEKLQCQMGALFTNKADLVYSNILMFFESGIHKISDYWPTSTIKRLLCTNHITLSSVIVKFDKDLYFSEHKKFAGVEDYELWLRLSFKKLKFIFLKKPLVRYRVLNSSFSSLSRSKNELRIINLKKSFFPIISKLPVLRIILIISITFSYIRFFALKIFKR